VWTQSKSSSLALKVATQSGKRAVLMAEIIEKIKSVKMFCLEQPLAKRMKEIRNREMKSIGGSFLYSTATYFLNFLVKISIFVCLLCFFNAGNRFNARNVYVVISYYNLMGHSMLKCWPRSVADAREARALIEKLQEFLHSRDNIFSKCHFNDKISRHDDAKAEDKLSETIKLLEKATVNEQHADNPAVFMRNVRLTSRSRNASDLRCDYLELRDAKAYAIVGFSSSTEHSLLQTILGEIEVDSGVIEINGEISYASRVPCVMPGTVRENIVCGGAFDDYQDL
jgi:ABC-type multidrug transport system fused ATPase/permease subunit